jgi:hypothetical protein
MPITINEDLELLKKSTRTVTLNSIIDNKEFEIDFKYNFVDYDFIAQNKIRLLFEIESQTTNSFVISFRVKHSYNGVFYYATEINSSTGRNEIMNKKLYFGPEKVNQYIDIPLNLIQEKFVIEIKTDTILSNQDKIKVSCLLNGGL